MSWFPCYETSKINGAFRGFMKKWRSVLWHEPLRHAINWYVEANSVVGATEEALLLGVTGLELLAWVVLVDEEGTFTNRQFKNISADGKLRELLKRFAIPNAIPREFKDLGRWCKSRRCQDGPAVIADLRNALVHPKKGKRRSLSKASRGTRFEAKHLALSYLELVLLASFDYQGSYELRRFEGWKGDWTRMVPWVT